MMKHARVRGAAAMAALVMVGTQCGAETRRSEPTAARAEIAPGAAQPSDRDIATAFTYPPGRWRLAAGETLGKTVLWVSHILIRHEGSSRRVPCTVALWQLDGPRPQRTRAEAFDLAQKLATEAAVDPRHFADLARRYSDDITTRDSGGSLGGVRATDLERSEVLLDALAALRPNEVSRVVESSEGFHILLRRPPPDDARVSGAHIVIGHDSARWLHKVGLPPPARSRSEALALAASISAELSAHPERFEELVRRHSEHPDKMRDGDLGSWSIREPTHLPRQLDALQRLSIGDISPPIDTSYGIEILRRTPEQTRRSFAMQAIHVPFMPGDAESKRQAVQRATELSNELRKDPTQFDLLLSKYCCREPEQWSEGRELPGLTPALEMLEIGEVSGAPVEQLIDILIPKRVDPIGSSSAREVSYDLPAPEQVDLGVLAWRIPGSVIRAELDAVTRGAEIDLGLSSTEQQVLTQMTATLASPQGGIAPSALLGFFGDVNGALGEQRGKTYRDLVDRRLQRILLGQEGSVPRKARGT
jgi:hypothetical protein